MSWMFDNFLFRGVAKILETLGLSLLWLFLCLPIVTIGAANTALYYSVNKTLKYNRGYAIRGFWQAFKDNFKQSTVVGLFFTVWLVILGYDCYMMYSFYMMNEPMGKYRVAVYALTLLVVAWSTYVFPYIARFENTTKEVFKNTFMIAVANAPTTIISTGWLIMCGYIIYRWTPVIIVMPAIYTVIQSAFIEKVFRKYMTKEQIELEQERNGVVYNDDQPIGLFAKLKKKKNDEK